jgi:hypothetical protein
VVLFFFSFEKDVCPGPQQALCQGGYRFLIRCNQLVKMINKKLQKTSSKDHLRGIGLGT